MTFTALAKILLLEYKDSWGWQKIYPTKIFGCMYQGGGGWGEGAYERMCMKILY